MKAMGVDVSEVYSPPRIVAMALKFGLRAGFSLDITTDDDTGMPWDFDAKCEGTERQSERSC